MQTINENNTKIIHRILQFIEFKHISINQLSLVIGVSNSYFSKMAKSEGSMGEDVVRRILLCYEDLNANWLLTGRQTMLATAQVTGQEPTDNQIESGVMSALISANTALASANETILLQQKFIANNFPPPTKTNNQVYTNAHEPIDK